MNWEDHCAKVAEGEIGFPVVEVVWEDAAAIALEWEDEADHQLRLTTTVGYLVKETRAAITIVSIINQEHIGHGIVVPKRVILSRRVLTPD